MSEREQLEALGYSEAWLEAGLLDRALLAEQYERMQSGGTKKTAKYRAQALAAWRDGAGPVDDTAIDAYLAVMAAEPDGKLAGTAVSELIQSPRITLEQLEKIARSDPKLMKRHEALIRRTYLTRRMSDGVTDALLDQVLELGDAAIQTGLVRDERLTKKQAEQLAKRGANPTIREKAAAWVQDKKAWK